MLFARKNVHLGYMSPPGQTLRALNHSFFQRKRRLRSPDGHKPMHFLWETHTLVTIGPKGLTSRALNHSFSMLTANIVAMGSHMADFMALNMLKSASLSLSVSIVVVLIISLSLSLSHPYHYPCVASVHASMNASIQPCIHSFISLTFGVFV